MTTCAICTADITGPIHREPLGRGNALVPVCYRCATESPRQGNYSFGHTSGRGTRIGDGRAPVRRAR